MRKMKQILMKSKLLLLPILLFIIFTIMPKIVLAQSGFDNNVTDAAGVDVVDVPLDGGALILIAAGVFLGVYKLYRIAQHRLVSTN